MNVYGVKDGVCFVINDSIVVKIKTPDTVHEVVMSTFTDMDELEASLITLEKDKFYKIVTHVTVVEVPEEDSSTVNSYRVYGEE